MQGEINPKVRHTEGPYPALRAFRMWISILQFMCKKARVAAVAAWVPTW